MIIKQLATIPLVTALALSGCAVDRQSASIDHPEIQPVGRYASGTFFDGAAEIVDWHNASQSIFIVNAGDKSVDILDASRLTSEALANPLTDSNLTKRGSIDLQGYLPNIELGAANSLSVHDNLLAVAVEAANKQELGVVILFTINHQGNVTYKDYVHTSALPDMVTFTPNGQYVLVANEGEPSKDYKVDPEGSISRIEILDNGTVGNVTQIGFSDFNQYGSRHHELSDQVRVFGRNATVAQDLEPEYITVSEDSKMAFVSLQENNAQAIIDIERAEVVKIFPLGYKDYGKYTADISNKDGGVNLKTWSGVYGMYQPDTIASYQVDGKTYVVSANEGDARDYWYNSPSKSDCLASGGLKYDEEDGCLAFTEEFRVKKIKVSNNHPNASKAKDNAGLARLKITNTLGDTDNDGQFEQLYAYGGRSFSIWDEAGNLVFDSGDDFERITADILKSDFNNNDDETKGDNRSDDKGPEPEALAIGEMNGRHYVFIGLERTGGLFMYDISQPDAPEYVRYIHNRDFSVDVADQPETRTGR
ncbi:choice-of-anchor I family protein [Endozoicomonas ascidiicola]|uniref:choice-of-anchor I family protein n=1 Tax=Endozoicomonas ascidiicola TaxID=1698521 RepID=UPI00083741D8|nr:choice-of-anchor I family protein [Endozoicomonas ascidiicola]